MLDYKLVEAFAGVVTEGGFEKAAKALHITQSAVSQRIKLLEERVGRPLLVRSSPPRPTGAGVDMLRHYRQVRRLEDDLGGRGSAEGDELVSLSIGVNADSLATWFFPAVEAFLDARPALLDIRADDQAETHRLLRNGDVLGCVSDRSDPMQGCVVESLGVMEYRMYCTTAYKAKWFPKGVTREGVERAPMLIFNRKDVMHERLIFDALGESPDRFSGFYLPSSERFPSVVASGRVCGMLPMEQAAPLLERGEIVDLAPGHAVPIALHWHCWNLASPGLRDFTAALTVGARRLLASAPSLPQAGQ